MQNDSRMTLVKGLDGIFRALIVSNFRLLSCIYTRFEDYNHDYSGRICMICFQSHFYCVEYGDT